MSKSTKKAAKSRQHANLSRSSTLPAPPSAFRWDPKARAVKEVWELLNLTSEDHNFHIHQTRFRLLSGGTFTGTTIPTTLQDGLVLHDNVPLPRAANNDNCDGSVDAFTSGACRPVPVVVEIPFREIGDFVYHCHILEHEDGGMMARIRVVAPPKQPGQAAASTAATTYRLTCWPSAPGPGPGASCSPQHQPDPAWQADGRSSPAVTLPASRRSICSVGSAASTTALMPLAAIDPSQLRSLFFDTSSVRQERMLRLTELKLPLDHSESALRDAVLPRSAFPPKTCCPSPSPAAATTQGGARRSTWSMPLTSAYATKPRSSTGPQPTRASGPAPTRVTAPPSSVAAPPRRPVVIGTGPCGLLAALTLAQMGFRPLILERGKLVRERTKDTWGLWRRGILNPESNVQFGEGGAGTFSDGKLYSGIKDPRHLDAQTADRIRRSRRA